MRELEVESHAGKVTLMLVSFYALHLLLYCKPIVELCGLN